MCVKVVGREKTIYALKFVKRISNVSKKLEKIEIIDEMDCLITGLNRT